MFIDVPFNPKGQRYVKVPETGLRTKSHGINAAAVLAPPPTKKKNGVLFEVAQKNYRGTPWPVLRMFPTGKGMLCALADSLLFFLLKVLHPKNSQLR